LSSLSARLEGQLRTLSSSYFSEGEEFKVVPLQSGPKILQGTLIPLPNVILAVGANKAVLLKTDVFLRKVRRKLWEGNPIRVGYREEWFTHRLVLEGDVQRAYVSSGPVKKLLEEVARPVID
jgi:hypothetical protein